MPFCIQSLEKNGAPPERIWLLYQIGVWVCQLCVCWIHFSISLKLTIVLAIIGSKASIHCLLFSPENSISCNLYLSANLISISLQGTLESGSSQALMHFIWKALWYNYKFERANPPLSFVRCRVSNFNLGCFPFQMNLRIIELSLFQNFLGAGNAIIELRKLIRGKTFILTLTILACGDKGIEVHFFLEILLHPS